MHNNKPIRLDRFAAGAFALSPRPRTTPRPAQATHLDAGLTLVHHESLVKSPAARFSSAPLRRSRKGVHRCIRAAYRAKKCPKAAARLLQLSPAVEWISNALLYHDECWERAQIKLQAQMCSQSQGSPRTHPKSATTPSHGQIERKFNKS